MSVVVIGSANLDLVYEVERIPVPGETVLSRGLASFPGGKGNNQAIAAARAGAETRLIAALGRDEAADALVAQVQDAGVVLLDRRVDAPTGTALIFVDRKGENSIVVNSGANAALVDLTDAELAEIAEADVMVVQLETPLPTVMAAIRAARAADTVVVLNAAPSGAFPVELLGEVDILIVNEHEAAELAGEPAGTGERSLMSVLASHGCDVVITLGSDGAFVGGHGTQPVKIAAFPVEVKDTTGAGDVFVGAFAACVDRRGDERSLVEATEFATAAAAIAVQRKGAGPSIPTLHEIKKLLAF